MKFLFREKGKYFDEFNDRPKRVSVLRGSGGGRTRCLHREYTGKECR
jgi:hypothetical protein